MNRETVDRLKRWNTSDERHPYWSARIAVIISCDHHRDDPLDDWGAWVGRYEAHHAVERGYDLRRDANRKASPPPQWRLK